MENGTCSTTELSAATGMSVRTVSFWAATGRIRAEKDGAGEYRIPIAEAERVRDELAERCLSQLQRLVESR